MDYILAPFLFVAKNLSVPGASIFIPREAKFGVADVPDLSGKVALVTGGSEGLGLACVKILLLRNVEKVFILSHRESVYQNTIKKMNKDEQSRLEWVQCDLSKWESDVVNAAKKISSSTNHLDIVINNAARGIMTPQSESHGLDLHMSSNHIGHVALMAHLLPLLKKSAENETVRIVNLASMSHEQAPPDATFESEKDFKKGIGIHKTYARSKLANILYTRWMAARLPKNILINATHPGVVNTPATNEMIFEAYPILGYGMSWIMWPIKKSAEQGALSSMFAATVTTGTGQYITPPAQVEAGTEQSRDEGLQDKLMKTTIEIIAKYTDAKSKGCPLSAA